ncbi:MAG: glycosyltransferase, partial [Bacteroidota bacterium]
LDSITVVDDHSSDHTVLSVADFPEVKLLHLANYQVTEPIKAHKKAAITYGIQEGKEELIVTSDADSRWAPTVLGHIKEAYQLGYNFISGPVLIKEANNWCSGFQALDLLAYMLLTAAYHTKGLPILANGAHLAFSRQLFRDIDGYKGVDHLPSGDDILLLQKALDQGKAKVTFLASPEAVVLTHAVPTWSALWAQRLRWASKTGAYTRPVLGRIQAGNFLFALLIVVSLPGGILYTPLLWSGLAAWLIKAVIDFWLLSDACRHFNRSQWMRFYPLALLVQPLFLLAVGSASLLGFRSKWKGRPIN